MKSFYVMTYDSDCPIHAFTNRFDRDSFIDANRNIGARPIDATRARSEADREGLVICHGHGCSLPV